MNDIARIACAGLLAVISGVVLLVPPVSQSVSASIICWLSFILLFGVTLNTAASRPIGVLAALSFYVAGVMLFVMLFQESMLFKFTISGNPISEISQIPSKFIYVLLGIHLGLFAATAVFTLLACYARPLLFWVMRSCLGLSRSRAEMIERNIIFVVLFIILNVFATWIILVQTA